MWPLHASHVMMMQCATWFTSLLTEAPPRPHNGIEENIQTYKSQIGPKLLFPDAQTSACRNESCAPNKHQTLASFCTLSNPIQEPLPYHMMLLFSHLHCSCCHKETVTVAQYHHRSSLRKICHSGPSRHQHSGHVQQCTAQAMPETGQPSVMPLLDLGIMILGVAGAAPVSVSM